MSCDVSLSRLVSVLWLEFPCLLHDSCSARLRLDDLAMRRALNVSRQIGWNLDKGFIEPPFLPCVMR
jgi:hypothetical protein